MHASTLLDAGDSDLALDVENNTKFMYVGGDKSIFKVASTPLPSFTT